MIDKSHESGPGAVGVSGRSVRRMFIFAVGRDTNLHLARIEPRREVDVPETRSHRVRATT